MRSRTSRGVPEWSGGEELYIGSPVSATGKVSGVTGIVSGPPEGSRGPSGGATYPGGPHGLKWEGNQPLVGWCAPHGPPPAPRVGNPGGGGRPTWLGGQATPLGRPPPLEIASPRAGAPLGPPIYSGGDGGSLTFAFGASLSLSNTSSSSIELGEALPEYCSSITTTTSCCYWSHLPQPLLPLAGSRRRRRRYSVRVLNAEVPSVRRSVIGDLDHDEYDSINPVHLNASA